MKMAEVEGGEMPLKQCGEDDVCIVLPENDEQIPVSPLKVDGYNELQLSEKSQDLLIVASLTCLCFILLAWVLFRHMHHQKEWQQASNLQLKQISQRNTQTNLQPKEEEKRTTKAKATPLNVSSKISKDSCKEMGRDRIRSIRAQQQEQNEVKAKLAKQQKRLAKEEKKRQIYESLQHEDADRAYERRSKLIREEQSMLQVATQERSTSNEAEETERRELLRIQNLEYEESLRRDQERLLQATKESERYEMRARTLQDAILRLERAGIRTADLSLIEHNTTVEIRDEDKIQVRLMLPSGKRVQTTYSKYHSIGLVYDLALVILNYNQQEVPDRNADVNASTTEEEERCNQSEERRNHAEWKELFDPFTINTTFPPQSFEELDLTLEQCGLQQSVMFMVVVESD